MKNGGLDQYDNEPLEQQQFGPADVEGVKAESMHQTNKTDILDSSCIRAITFKHTFTIMTKASFPFLAIWCCWFAYQERKFSDIFVCLLVTTG